MVEKQMKTFTAGDTKYIINDAEARAEVADLKSQLRQVSEASYMVVVEKGASANRSGEIVPFHIRTGDTVTVSTVDGSTFGTVQFRFYDANGQYIDYYALSSSYGSARTFTNQYAETFYVGITTVKTASPDKYLAVNKSNMFKLALDGLSSSIENNSADIADLNVLKPSKSIVNRFDKTNITENKYLSTSTGNLLNDSTNSFFASDFIYVGDLEKVIISGTHIVCWYDASKTFASCPENMNSGSNDITLTIPSGVKYLRFSAYKTSLNMAQIGENVSRSNYFPYGYYTLPGLIVDGDAIIVDANGNGDYTSFTLAMKENYDNKKDVIVKPGTYNIVTEYTAIWGAEAVAAMADADGAIFDGWQYGIKLNGRKIEFMPGAKLVCDWTGHTVDGTHRFSALRVEMNVEIIGLDIDCTGTFYVIHDDYGNNQSTYTNIYRNCRVIGHSISNANCIGGGCKKYSRHIIENCYFDNGGLSSSTTVRYHNTNSDGAVPELFISNCFFNGWVTPRYYGTQTTKMRAYINNCKAQKIAVIAESVNYTTENVDLFKWCNEEAE